VKVHELDWQEVLGALPRWEALSPDGRRAFLGIKPGQSFHRESLGAAAGELEAAGLLVAPTGRGTLYGLDPAARPLLVALRAAQRLHPLHGEGGTLRIEYVQDQLTSDQAQAIGAPEERGYYHSGDRLLAAETASSVAWMRAFLAAGTHPEMIKWERRWLVRTERPRLVFPLVAEALRALVQALASHPGGRVPLRALPGLLPAVDPATRGRALAAGLRYLLVFVSIGGDAEAVVGLLPAVAARLAGAPSPPGPVEAREPFAFPFRVGDVTALLVEAATEPIAVRAADHTLYVRAQRAIAARLASVPHWVERFAEFGLAAADEGEEDESARLARVEWAAHLATLLRLAKLRSAGDRLVLTLTDAGRAWLNQGEGEHLKELLAALRALPQRTPSAYEGSEKLDFFDAPLPFQVDEKKLDLRAALSAAFLSVPPGALVSVAAFMRFQARERNPFLGPDGPTKHVRAWWSSIPRTLEGWEAAWGTLLLGFLARRLVPLGCATLARDEGGALAFGLTDAGRYLLGAADDLALAPAAAGGEVVVQPDFEIVFLAPAPRAEAELGRVAERTGAGVGALFRLTRASVLRAAEQGMSVDQVLGTLESLARSGVPANVARQVRDWMQSVRRVRIAPAVLVECPDPETAGRVRALGGASVTEVTPTLLRLSADAKTRAALVKRLRDRGIFVAAVDG